MSRGSANGLDKVQINDQYPVEELSGASRINTAATNAAPKADWRTRLNPCCLWRLPRPLIVAALFALLVGILLPTPSLAEVDVVAVQEAAPHGAADAAATAHAHFEFPIWTVLPFASLLLCIALLPLIAGHFWHSNVNKGLVAVGLSVPILLYLVIRQFSGGDNVLPLLGHALQEYFEFIMLLASLYTVAGGIVLEGDFKPTPLVNTLFLATGAILANLIGTTGSSMLLIRPVLRINLARKSNRHIPIFFIFAVSNLGGLLTPLGDPPLFLGFLRGVSFFWTMSLWPQWLIANGLVLAIFFAWDTLAYRAGVEDNGQNQTQRTPFRLRGLINILFLAGIIGAVLMQSRNISDPVTNWLRNYFDCPDLNLHFPRGGLVMAAMGGLSLLFTPRRLRQQNEFTWEAILEVAVLFIGIFITMVPALALLEGHGPELGINRAWQYFWFTGLLSGFLDNAPTYLTFATVAAHGPDFSVLMTGAQRPLLAAVSCGAVFLGAMTYIGNGPNFMVKAIAEGAGYRTPSFFGYLLYSSCILLPIFTVITLIFFNPT